MIPINKDYFNNIVPPDYILCKANRERIGILNCTEKTLDIKFNDINEINFKTNLYIDGNTKNPHYEAVDVMKYILLPGIGFFCISSVNTESEGTKEESKTVTAKEYQCRLAQRYLELFVINKGTNESVGGKTGHVTFYNPMNKERSLLHLILEKFPEWSIGHVDPLLASLERGFEVTRQDVYSFLTTDIAKAFGCIFIFNTLNNTINAYEEKTLGIDTDLHVSYNNLLKNTSVSCSTDDIKTCLTVYGRDNMDVREVNMGLKEIYNFDYYNSPDFWSKGLLEAYRKWTALRNSYLSEYSSLQKQHENCLVDKYYLRDEKMPKTEGSTNWTEYGLNPLYQQYKEYNNDRSRYRALGYDKETSEGYEKYWLPIIEAIGEEEEKNDENGKKILGGSIGKQYAVIDSEIDDIDKEINNLEAQKKEIFDIVSMENRNNFTEDQLKELYAFIREDELSTENFLITDIMSEEQKIKERHNLLKYGEEELAKVSVPQLSFKADMVNLFAIPEFQNFSGNFDVGNYIWVSLRDDYSVKARLLSVHINFYDLTDFSVEFGNVTRKSKNVYTDITDAIKMAQSAATSVSFHSSNWNKANETSAAIDQMIADGLLSAGAVIKSGEDSELIIDKRGIYVNTTTGDYIGDSIYMGNGRILFTQDNWLTVEEAIGRVNINGESVFGVIAKAVLAGNIIGSTITGGNIYGTTIAVGGQNNESGVLTVFDGNTPPNPLVTLDQRGITLAENVSISWNNITGTENVAYTSDIPTDEHITTMITENAITCETITGNTITGKRFKSDDEFVGINCAYGDGWAIYAGAPLENPVAPYTDQRTFNIGHGGEMYADRGMFRNLRIEDRCAGADNVNNSDVVTGIDFIYSKGNSTPIHIGTIYQDASAFRLNSDNNIELNATKNDDSTVSIYGPKIILGGTVSANYSILHKQSADFYYNDSHFGTLYADEWGMVIKSPNGEINFYAPDSGEGHCNFNLEVEMRNTVYDESGSSVISSDKNLKNSIESLNKERSAEFIYSLVPCKFKYNIGTSDRYHHGLIAQEVKESMDKLSEDWGLYVEYLSNGELRRGLRNEELIADLIATIQTQNIRIKNLEEKI